MSEPEKEIPVAAATTTERIQTPRQWIGLGAVSLAALAAIGGDGGNGKAPGDITVQS